ncbi:MAG: MFS transporter [Candidatus Lernaella stagnicola]|nr:MFS transporter [Candidatus Lernaella stagnicola]
MIRRFSLYGFLKNQQYFEPFLILYLRDLGLSFTMIGVLIGYREVLVNLFEVPSGVVADLWGRRRSMVTGWFSYIISFVLFALAPRGSVGLVVLFAAITFFAGGEAFRTGTHKAMIFTWLRLEGRTSERTKVYGLTRSWAKAGSALSVIIAGVLVFVTGGYRYIWWLCLAPYVANMFNLATYPKELDGEVADGGMSVKKLFVELWRSIRLILRHRPLRGLFAESLGFDGLFTTTKDYIQPIVRQAALTLPLFALLEGEQRVAVLVSAAYLLIYLIGFFAARNAHRIETWSGGDVQGARRVWLGNLVTFGALLVLLVFEQYVWAIVVYLVAHLLHNIWRPLMLSRYDEHTPSERQATVLSVDAQAKSAFAMVFAPIIGFSVDHFGLWPLGLIGVVVSMAGWLWSRRGGQGSALSGETA